MLSLACDLAIFKRLTGHPLDSQGRPVRDPVTHIPINRHVIGPPNGSDETLAPSYGVRIPTPKGPTGLDLKTNNPDAIKLYDAGFHRDDYRQVPVFWDGTTGREWDGIWPCVVFGQSGEIEHDVYTYYADIDQVDLSAGTAILDDGTTEVPAGYFTSPQPEQSIYTYVIKAYAKNRVEMSLLDDQIKRLFPQKGAILVERADGSLVPFDMIRGAVDDISPRGSDKEKALIGDQRFYAKAYNYRIEAYGDYTVRGFGDQFSQEKTSVILTHVMEMVDFQTQVVTQSFEISTTLEEPLDVQRTRRLVHGRSYEPAKHHQHSQQASACSAWPVYCRLRYAGLRYVGSR